MDFSWPLHNHGHANATLVQRTLDASQRPVGIVKFRVVTPFLVGPIVRSEKDHGILLNLQSL